MALLDYITAVAAVVAAVGSVFTAYLMVRHRRADAPELVHTTFQRLGICESTLAVQMGLKSVGARGTAVERVVLVAADRPDEPIEGTIFEAGADWKAAARGLVRPVERPHVGVGSTSFLIVTFPDEIRRERKRVRGIFTIIPRYGGPLEFSAPV